MQRRKLNFSGLSEREKDKMRLFEKYDVERREREFQEVLGVQTKYIMRPIKRNALPRFRIEEFKEEAYCKIEQLRAGLFSP